MLQNYYKYFFKPNIINFSLRYSINKKLKSGKMREVLVIQVVGIENNLIRGMGSPSQYSVYGHGSSTTYPMGTYNVLSEFMIGDELEQGDNFLCRYDNKNYDFKLLCFEKIYTINNYLEVCLVVDNEIFDRVEKYAMEEQANSLGSNYTGRVTNSIEEASKSVKCLSENFRKCIADGQIDIDYKSFDRINKIDKVLKK